MLALQTQGGQSRNMQMVVYIAKREKMLALAWVYTETMLKEVSTKICLEDEHRFGWPLRRGMRKTMSLCFGLSHWKDGVTAGKDRKEWKGFVGRTESLMFGLESILLGTWIHYIWIYQAELRCWTFAIDINPGEDTTESMVIFYQYRNNLTLSKLSYHSVLFSSTLYRVSSGCLQCSRGC